MKLKPESLVKMNRYLGQKIKAISQLLHFSNNFRK